MMSEIPKVKLDLKGIREYAKNKGVAIASLTEEEKQLYIIKWFLLWKYAWWSFNDNKFSSLPDFDISDILGANSKLYTNKLKQAKDDSFEQLRNQTFTVEGNAIIGLSINYAMISGDIMKCSCRWNRKHNQK